MGFIIDGQPVDEYGRPVTQYAQPVGYINGNSEEEFNDYEQYGYGR